MNVFERYLTVWVFLCIVVGIAVGQWLPGPVQAVGRMEIAADPFRRAVAVAPGDVRAYAGLWTIQARRHRAPRPARLRAWILALDPGFDEERARRGSGLSG